MRLSSGARVALTALAALFPARALAAGESSESPSLPIALELGHCDTFDHEALFKLLAIEFQTLDVRPQTPLERVHIECGTQRAKVTLESARASNEVDLAATTPAVWPRLLALSVSEIVIESRARVAPAPVAPLTRAAPVSDKAPIIAHKDVGVRFSAGVGARRAVRPATWLAGPDLGVALDLSRHFSVAVDWRIELGRTDTELAKVSWASTSGALTLLVGGNLGRLSLGVGPGWCLGYLRLSPQVKTRNATGHSVSGIWAGPELVVRARYDLGARWFALGGVDSGIVTAPVTGLVNGEQRLVDTGGPWVSLTAGGGVLF